MASPRSTVIDARHPAAREGSEANALSLRNGVIHASQGSVWNWERSSRNFGANSRPWRRAAWSKRDCPSDCRCVETQLHPPHRNLRVRVRMPAYICAYKVFGISGVVNFFQKVERAVKPCRPEHTTQKPTLTDRRAPASRVGDRQESLPPSLHGRQGVPLRWGELRSGMSESLGGLGKLDHRRAVAVACRFAGPAQRRLSSFKANLSVTHGDLRLAQRGFSIQGDAGRGCRDSGGRSAFANSVSTWQSLAPIGRFRLCRDSVSIGGSHHRCFFLLRIVCWQWAVGRQAAHLPFHGDIVGYNITTHVS